LDALSFISKKYVSADSPEYEKIYGGPETTVGGITQGVFKQLTTNPGVVPEISKNTAPAILLLQSPVTL
jgi:hypothetical protein